MAKPKLCLIPAAQGSKLFSVLPSSGVGDFDFTRSGSATRINSQGLIETVGNGVSRLNYPLLDGKVVGCPHHLLEPQSTNLISNSENLIDGGAGWINQLGGTVVGNQFSEISGKNDAWQLNKASGTFKSLRLQQTLSSSTYTLSWYLKQGNINKAQFRFDGGLGAQYVLFDLLEGTYTDNANLDNIQINSAGGGWYRCQATITGSLTNVHLYIDDSAVSTAAGYIYAQYPQIEAQSYATSYIPTQGSAVTRSAETATGSGDAATFNDSEGVLMAEVSSLVNSDTYRLISLNDNSNSNEIFVGFRFDTGKLYYNIDSGGVGQSGFISDVTALNTSCKFCVKYKQNDISFYINGFKLYSDSSANMPTGLSVLKMSRGNDTLPFYGKTKQIQYYDTALTDSELEILTSWVSFTEMAQGQLYTIE